MADTEQIRTLQDYFRKLQRILQNESDFTFCGYKLVKKDKIDDVLCCILATFPERYKKLINDKKARTLSSILAYNLLFNAAKQRFAFNSNVYLVHYENVKKYIDTIIRNIERDIDFIEKNFS